MTADIPLVIYKDGQRINLGRIKIEDDRVSGQILNKEVASLFSGDEPVGQFILVAEPAVEKLKGLNFVIDEYFPPGEIRVVSTEDDLRKNEIRVFLDTLERDKLTIMSPDNLIIKQKDPNED